MQESRGWFYNFSKSSCTVLRWRAVFPRALRNTMGGVCPLKVNLSVRTAHTTSHLLYFIARYALYCFAQPLTGAGLIHGLSTTQSSKR